MDIAEATYLIKHYCSVLAIDADPELLSDEERDPKNLVARGYYLVDWMEEGVIVDDLRDAIAALEEAAV